MRAASRVPTVLGLAGLLAALAFFGGSAGLVRAELNAETTNTVAATGKTWSVEPSATTVSMGRNQSRTFTLDNTGNTVPSRVASVTVTGPGGTVTFRLCQPSGTCTTYTSSAKTVTNWTPTPAIGGSSGNWTVQRNNGGANSAQNFSISVTVSSADVPAGSATNG